MKKVLFFALIPLALFIGLGGGMVAGGVAIGDTTIGCVILLMSGVLSGLIAFIIGGRLFRQIQDECILAVRQQREYPSISNQITQREIVSLFGDTMPIEAVTLLLNASDIMTIDELRQRLRAIAKDNANI